MRANQEIFRVRRQYNKWVANQTLEDYSLRFTASSYRRWPIDRVAKTALGATAFLALEAIAASLTLSFGFINTLWAMLVVAIVILGTGYPISYYAARYGLDIDLLTRSAGFGYLGSTITSLIYASFTFIFFAIEAAILASALKALFAIPLWLGYIICAIAVVPIVTHGIAAISRFQVGTQPVWLALQILALGIVGVFEYHQFVGWVQYAPADVSGSEGFDLALFGAAAAIMFAMIAQIGEQVDYLRFMPKKTTENSRSWWFWMLLAGPGWILIGLIKMLFGSFMAYLLVSRGSSFDLATDPTYMYQQIFAYLVQSPTAALGLAGVMVIISQMKINVTNAYAGSLAWSNFFSRLTHNHPGRVVWLVFNVIIALILMELGIYRALEAILGVFAIVALSWLTCIAVDLSVNMKMGLRPREMEFKRAYLYDINPVGVFSMLLASLIGILCYLGYLGPLAKHLAHFVSIAICLMCVPTIAFLTKGKYYIARQPDLIMSDVKSGEHQECCICENTFEPPDMAFCPAYQGTICSLCCSLDTRCLDACKPKARIGAQTHHFLSYFVSEQLLAIICSRVGKFIGTFAGINLVSALLLALVYYHTSPMQLSEKALLQNTLIALYFILMIVFGVIVWLFILAQESREMAQQESNRQTRLLLEEINAHQTTDRELQEAKEFAERANQAKSRYLTGISHELRTPLQSIYGYAQLLSGNEQATQEQHKGLKIIRRNSEHLADLIEGLLDISKIEAGRLDIYRDRIYLPDLLDQIEQIFIPQSEERGITFDMNRADNLPGFVIADQRRLRQIFINLLTNAFKYTEKGRVEVQVSYRSQLMEFRVIDTGVGIEKVDIQRILDPFERVRNVSVPDVSGTGLGLTIVRLLTDIMGGDLKITSTPGEGSEFCVTLLVSETTEKAHSAVEPRAISGYEGAVRTILVVDDEAVHRGLIADLLQPLGFRVFEAHDASSALRMFSGNDIPEVDLFLLDISMPDKDGLTLARELRQLGCEQPMAMLSADAEEQHLSQRDDSDNVHQAYITKPMNNRTLLSQIKVLLGLEWQYQTGKADLSHMSKEQESLVSTEEAEVDPEVDQTDLLPLLRELIANAEMGFRKGVQKNLNQLEDLGWPHPDEFKRWTEICENYRFAALVQRVQQRMPK